MLQNEAICTNRLIVMKYYDQSMIQESEGNWSLFAEGCGGEVRQGEKVLVFSKPLEKFFKTSRMELNYRLV